MDRKGKREIESRNVLREREVAWREMIRKRKKMVCKKSSEKRFEDIEKECMQEIEIVCCKKEQEWMHKRCEKVKDCCLQISPTALKVRFSLAHSQPKEINFQIPHFICVLITALSHFLFILPISQMGKGAKEAAADQIVQWCNKFLEINPAVILYPKWNH